MDQQSVTTLSNMQTHVRVYVVGKDTARSDDFGGSGRGDGQKEKDLQNQFKRSGIAHG